MHAVVVASSLRWLKSTVAVLAVLRSYILQTGWAWLEIPGLHSLFRISRIKARVASRRPVAMRSIALLALCLLLLVTGESSHEIISIFAWMTDQGMQSVWLGLPWPTSQDQWTHLSYVAIIHSMPLRLGTKWMATGSYKRFTDLALKIGRL